MHVSIRMVAHAAADMQSASTADARQRLLMAGHGIAVLIGSSATQAARAADGRPMALRAWGPAPALSTLSLHSHGLPGSEGGAAKGWAPASLHAAASHHREACACNSASG